MVVIKDRGRAEIAEAIEEEAAAVGAQVFSWLMEEVVERPALEFPRRLAEKIRAVSPTVSFFIAEALPGELGFRQPMRVFLVDELRCRHAHMVGIDARVMEEGMAGDCQAVWEATERVFQALRSASQVEVATRLGTELTAKVGPPRRWVPCHGRYWEQGQWGNLPEGEVFTAPLDLEGVLVGEELGDHFAARYGLLERPVRIRIRGGRVLGVEAPGQPQLKAELESYLSQHSNSSLVGEFAIGTNITLKRMIGNLLQDEKFPGVHVAFGDPYPEVTGADWSCPTHLDVLASRADVWVDGRLVMEAGRPLV